MSIKDAEIKNAPILIVDDSRTSIRVMESLLQKNGYQNITTLLDPTGVAGAFQDTEFALMIFDYHMPGLTGGELLEELNKQFPSHDINVLFWTAATEEELYSTLLRKEGAKDILRKNNMREAEIVCRVRNLIVSYLSTKQIVLQNNELNKKVHQRTKELERATLDTIERLAMAAEFRAEETGKHIRRIGALSAELAYLLGLDREVCIALRYAAPLHDTGKIGVSDEILFKPGPLNDKEWMEMKKHTQIGAQILDGSHQDIIKMAQKIALSHHERWEGDGYPEGRKNTDIPIEARIVAICDVFDALLSVRVYKEPWEKEQTIELSELPPANTTLPLRFARGFEAHSASADASITAL